jgi:sodium/potassium-transporting ATPase subunit alpha
LLVLGLIVYTPWGNAVFGTAPLACTALLVCLPFAVLMLLAEEIRKALVRRRNSRGALVAT